MLEFVFSTVELEKPVLTRFSKVLGELVHYQRHILDTHTETFHIDTSKASPLVPLDVIVRRSHVNAEHA